MTGGSKDGGGPAAPVPVAFEAPDHIVDRVNELVQIIQPTPQSDARRQNIATYVIDTVQACFRSVCKVR